MSSAPVDRQLDIELTREVDYAPAETVPGPPPPPQDEPQPVAEQAQPEAVEQPAITPQPLGDQPEVQVSPDSPLVDVGKNEAARASQMVKADPLAFIKETAKEISAEEATLRQRLQEARLAAGTDDPRFMSPAEKYTIDKRLDAIVARREANAEYAMEAVDGETPWWNQWERWQRKWPYVSEWMKGDPSNPNAATQLLNSINHGAVYGYLNATGYGKTASMLRFSTGGMRGIADLPFAFGDYIAEGNSFAGIASDGSMQWNRDEVYDTVAFGQPRAGQNPTLGFLDAGQVGYGFGFWGAPVVATSVLSGGAGAGFWASALAGSGTAAVITYVGVDPDTEGSIGAAIVKGMDSASAGMSPEDREAWLDEPVPYVGGITKRQAYAVAAVVDSSAWSKDYGREVGRVVQMVEGLAMDAILGVAIEGAVRGAGVGIRSAARGIDNTIKDVKISQIPAALDDLNIELAARAGGDVAVDHKQFMDSMREVVRSPQSLLRSQNVDTQAAERLVGSLTYDFVVNAQRRVSQGAMDISLQNPGAAARLLADNVATTEGLGAMVGRYALENVVGNAGLFRETVAMATIVSLRRDAQATLLDEARQIRLARGLKPGEMLPDEIGPRLANVESASLGQDLLVVEDILASRGLGADAIYRHADAYMYQAVRAIYPNLTDAEARNIAGIAVRSGIVTPNQLGMVPLNHAHAEKIRGLPASQSKFLFQRVNELMPADFPNRNVFEDEILSMMLKETEAETGLNDADRAIVIRKRGETDLRPLRTREDGSAGQWNDYNVPDAPSQMASMRPITHDEVADIMDATVDEMVRSNRLPPAIAQFVDANGVVNPAEGFREYLRARGHTTAPRSAEYWRSLVGTFVEKTDPQTGAPVVGADGKPVKGWSNIDRLAAVDRDPTFGIRQSDIDEYLSKGWMDAEEHAAMTNHIAARNAKYGRVAEYVGAYGNGDFITRAISGQGADKYRFWYEIGSERLFGSDELKPIIRLPQTKVATQTAMLSVFSPRTNVEDNFLRAYHFLTRVALQGRVPEDVTMFGKGQEALQVIAGNRGRGTNAKVRNFDPAGACTVRESEVMLSGNEGRALLGPDGTLDLSVNDAICARFFNFVDKGEDGYSSAWSDNTIYEFGVRSMRRMRNIANARRAEILADANYSGPPIEVFEMRQLQAAPWDMENTLADTTPATVWLKDAADHFSDGSRATSFYDVAERVIWTLGQSPSTKHFYDQSNPNAKYWPVDPDDASKGLDFSRPYIDEEVLTHDDTWRVLQPTGSEKADAARMMIDWSGLDAGWQSELKRTVSDRINLVASALDVLRPLAALDKEVVGDGVVTPAENLIKGLNVHVGRVSRAYKEMFTPQKDTVKPGGMKSDTSAFGQYAAALLGRPMPNDSAGLFKDGVLNVSLFLEKSVETPNTNLDLLTDSKQWQVFGPQSSAGGRWQGVTAALFQTITDVDERGLVAEAMSEILGFPVEVARYLPAPEGLLERLPYRSKKEGYFRPHEYAREDNVRVRVDMLDQGNRNAAAELAGEMQNSGMLLHPDFIQTDGFRAIDIVDRSGAIMRLRTASPRDSFEWLRSKGHNVSLEILDPDSVSTRGNFLDGAVQDFRLKAQQTELTREFFDGRMTKAMREQWAKQVDEGLSPRRSRSLFESMQEIMQDTSITYEQAVEAVKKRMLRAGISATTANGKTNPLLEAIPGFVSKYQSQSLLYREGFWRKVLMDKKQGILDATARVHAELDEWKAKHAVPGARLYETAKKMGLNPDPITRFQNVAGNTRGLTWSPDGGMTAFVAAFEKADASTGVEELVHAIRLNATSRGGRTGSISNAEWRALEQYMGIGPDGWTVAKDERLAEMFNDWFFKGLLPEGAPRDVIWTFKRLTAETRDLYRDATSKGAIASVSPAMRDVIRRMDTQPGMPIRVADTRYHPAVDWTSFIRHRQGVRDAGQTWHDVIDPSDVLAHARIFQTDQQGLFTPTDARASILNDPEARKAMKADTHFGKGTREEYMEMMAIFEDYVRAVRNADPILQTRGMDSIRDEAINLYGRLINSPDGEIQQQMAQLMQVDLRSDDLAERVVAMNMVMRYHLQEVSRLAKKADRTKDAHDYAMLERAFVHFQQSQHHSAQMMTQLGRGLQALRGPIPTLNSVQRSNLQNAHQMMTGISASMARGQDLVEMVKGIDVERHSVAMARRIEQAIQSPFERVGNAFDEVYVNALLSAPTTFSGVSLIGPVMMTAIGGIERLAGGVLTGNKQQIRETFDNLTMMIGNSFTALHYAAQAFLKEAPVLMQTTGLTDQTGLIRGISGEAFGMEPGVAKSIVDVVGIGIRSPSRVILTIDEFFRQLHGRQGVFMNRYDYWIRQSIEDAKKSGVVRVMGNGSAHPEDARVIANASYSYAKSRATADVDKIIRDGTLRTREVLQNEAISDPAIGSIQDPFQKARAVLKYMHANYTEAHRSAVRSSEDYATRAVFQGELGPAAASFQNFLSNFGTLGKVVLPFYRTPMKILEKFGGWMPTTFLVEGAERLSQRAFNGSFKLSDQPMIRRLHQKTLEDLASGDPRRIAETRGRQAMGVAIFGLGYFLAQNGLITGGGPRNRDQRRAWNQTNQPYSIRLAGGDWISYAKMDPVGGSFALMADAIELLEASEYHGGINAEKTDLVQGIVYALGQQVRQKSYLQGIANIMDAFELNNERSSTIFRNVLTGMTPFSSAQRAAIRTEEDAVQREVRSMVDAYRARTFLGDDDNAPPARTPLGDLLKYQPTNSATARWVNLFNPMSYMAASDDPVYREINELGLLLNMPPQTEGHVTWTQVPMPGYQYSAYDWMVERTGTIAVRGTGGKMMTLRDTLMSLFDPAGENHGQWKALKSGGTTVTGESPAGQVVKQIISSFQSAARAEMVQKNPKAMEFERQIAESKQQAADAIQKSLRQSRPASTTSLAERIRQQAGRN